jgi:hypothetical protein
MSYVLGRLVGDALALALYLAPTILAARRHKRSLLLISLLDVLLGWTLLGWIAALIWAFLPDRKGAGGQ